MKRIGMIQFFLGICLINCTIFLFVASASADPKRANEHGTTPVVKGVKVMIVNAPKHKDMYLKMAKRLIRIKPGDPLNDSNLKTSVDALSLSNRFSDIHVDSKPVVGGELVEFTLTPFRFIKKIVISGNYPLFEGDILDIMTIYPGDVYRPEDLPQQVQAVIALYQREGYIDPKVSVSANSDSKTENVTIYVDIEKGKPYKPGALTFKGNRAIGTASLKPRMKTWRLGLLLGTTRFTEERLKKDIENLTSYYRKKGYAEVDISYKLDTKSHFPKVDVKVNIVEGPRYKIDFKGNHEFWNHTLKKDVVLFTQGNRRGLGLRKSISNIRERYLKAGFVDVKVVTREEKASDHLTGSKSIRFYITEGPHTKVSSVTISGNQMVQAQEIRAQILTQPPSMFNSGAFVQNTLDEDIFAINTLYLNQGFQDAKIDYTTDFTPDRTGVAIEIKIKEGVRTRVGSVVLKGSDLINFKDVKKKLQTQSGRPYRADFCINDESYLSSLVSEKGYPHVLVKSKVKLSPNRSLADVVYQIAPGPKVHLGQIFISGNLKTQEKIILRELKMKPDDPLSLQKLTDGQRAIRDLNIFRSVQYKAIGLAEKEDLVNLFVEVEENKPYYTQFEVGYDSENGTNSGVKLGNRNFLGLDKDIWGSARVSEIGYEVETGIMEPRLFDSKISSSLAAFNNRIKKKNDSYGTDILGGSLGFSRKWSDQFNTSLNFTIKQIDPFDNKTSDNVEELSTVLVTTPSIGYDSRDSFIKPTRGMISDISVDLSNQIEKIDESAQDDYVKYNLDLRYYVSPLEKVTLAWLGRIGYIQPYGGADPPDYALFKLGGINSVRGFDENLLLHNRDREAVGGKTALVGSFETRFDIGWNLDLTVFFDTGSVEDIPNANKDDVIGDPDEFRSSYGLGLRYMTAIGPIGFLYGRKLEVKQGEDPGRWHFSIGYTF
jgi:outer membrane protein insertion porin family